MEMIKTGIYKHEIIRTKKEILIPKNKLEKALEKISEFNKEREINIPNDTRGHFSNLDRRIRIEKTGYMLLEGKTIPEIAKEFGFVNSTIESYIESIIYQTQKLNN